MKSKDEIFDEVLGKEGGYVNHPDDKGGPTKWGITEKSPAPTDTVTICAI